MIIGVDAGGTWVKAARFSADLDKEQDVTVKSGAPDGKEAYFDSIAEAVRQLAGDTKPTDLAIGLSLPGTFTKDRSTIRYASNINGLAVGDDPVRIQDALADRLGTDHLVAENDAGCAALAEWLRGHGKGDPDTILLHVTWGTGIGTGLIVDGKSQYGWEGGHMPVSWGIPADTSCNRGSNIDLEARLGVVHLLDHARMLLEKGGHRTTLTADDLADNAEATKTLVPAAENGDELAQVVLKDALLWLARGLHTMSVLVYPDIVTVGGGMMASDWLLNELHAAITQEASCYLVDTLPSDRVQRAQLANEAGMIGAAYSAQQKFR